MKLKIFIGIAVVILVFGTLAGIKTLQIKKVMGMQWPIPTETVASATVQEGHWPETLSAIGSITAVQGVIVMPEVAGTVVEILFESGAMVKQGAPLVRLDSSTEEAQLRSLEAQVDLARINANRSRELRKVNTVSQADLDTAEGTLKQLEGTADAMRATIAKKNIRAPFTGRLGIRTVSLGEYVDTGKALVSLQSLDTVFADFSQPQQELSRIESGMKVHVSADTYTNRFFEGELTAVNPDLDVSTRNVRLQATLKNPDQLLRPGMFARIELLLPATDPVLVVPATAVLSAPYGDMVYVIEGKNGPDGKPVVGKDGKPLQFARQQLVRTGRSLGDFISIQLGLKAGEKVASSGVFKLRNGMGIVENNQLNPAATEAPKPPNS